MHTTAAQLPAVAAAATDAPLLPVTKPATAQSRKVPIMKTSAVIPVTSASVGTKLSMKR
jgi:hypothetical protein